MLASKVQTIISEEEANSKITRLEAVRQLVAEKFPDAMRAMVRQAFEGDKSDVSNGALTEVFGSGGSVSLFLQKIISARQTFVAWIDAGNTLDPAELPAECLRRLLWVRCTKASEAVQAVDFLLRDGNLPLLILDMRRISQRDLGRIPANTWYRFQRLLEPGASALAVATMRASIPSARVRVSVTNRWHLSDLLRERKELLVSLEAEAMHRGSEMGHQAIA